MASPANSDSLSAVERAPDFNNAPGWKAATTGAKEVVSTVDTATGKVHLERNGVHLSYSLPGAGNARKRSISADTSEFDAGSYQAVTQTGQDGVRTAVVINNAASPTSYRFHFDVPSGYTLKLTGDGHAAVIDNPKTGDAAVIMPPWADDATGKRVPSSYSVDGHDLILNVSTQGAVFPVVADPQVDWHWWGYSDSMDRWETNQFAYAAGDVAAGFATCGAALAIFLGPMAGLACAVESSSYWVMGNDAGLYYSDGNCMRLNMTWSSVWWSDEIWYGDGNCW